MLEHEEAKTGKICSRLNIPSSHIYTILDKLLQKGLVSFKLVNNIKVFRSVTPANLFSMFREKEKELEKEKKEIKQFISKLNKIQLTEHKENDFKYFEGTKGVRSMFNEFLKQMNPKELWYIASAPIAYKTGNAFFIEELHPARIKKKVQLKIIVPSNLKKHGKEREKLKLTEVKYSKTNFPSEFGVCGDQIYFLSFGDKPYALLIKDKNFAESQKQIFENLWNSLSL